MKSIFSVLLMVFLLSFVVAQASSTTEAYFSIGSEDETVSTGVTDNGYMDDGDEDNLDFFQILLVILVILLILYLLMKAKKKRTTVLSKTTSSKMSSQPKKTKKSKKKAARKKK